MEGSGGLREQQQAAQQTEMSSFGVGTGAGAGAQGAASQYLAAQSEEERFVFVLMRNSNRTNKYKCRDCNIEFIGGPKKIRSHFGVAMDGEELDRVMRCTKGNSQKRDVFTAAME